jgi:site-specific DNA recombinase
MGKKLIVGVYCRVSSTIQKEEGVGLDNQKLEGIKFCESKGFDYKVYMDDISGMKDFDQRKMFNKMRKDLNDKKINGVWIWNVGRGWRDDRYKWEFIDMFKGDSKLFSMGREFNFKDKNDLMMVGMSSLFYDFNRRDLLDNMIGGRRVKWSRGVGYSGGVIFGYKRIKENGESIIVVDEERSEVVKDIYKTYLRKDVLNIKECWERIIKKYPKYKEELMYDRVYKILRSERYKGKSVIFDKKEKKEYEFQFDRIIDDELYEKRYKKDKKTLGVRVANNTKEKYLLKGKMKCKCGDNMWIMGSKTYKYYMCQRNLFNRKKKDFDSFKKSEVKDKCEFNSRISVESLERVIWSGLYEFLENSERLKGEYKIRYEKDLGNKNEFIGKKKYYQKELDSWNSKKNNNVDLLLDNTLSKEDFNNWKENKFEVEVETIKNRLVEIDNELNKLELSESMVDSYIELMREDLNKEKDLTGFKDKLKKINKYVDEIKVENVGSNKWNLDVKLFQPFMEDNLIELRDKSKDYILNFNKLI